jgi:DNA-binding NarL/FixJ family response regulator
MVPANARRKAAKAIERGARGVIFRSAPPEKLLTCIRTVYIGGLSIERSLAISALERLRRMVAHPLTFPPELGVTDGERELIRCVAIGLSNRQIAKRSNRTQAAIKKRLSLLYKKLGVKDRRSLLSLVSQPEHLLGPS